MEILRNYCVMFLCHLVGSRVCLSRKVCVGISVWRQFTYPSFPPSLPPSLSPSLLTTATHGHVVSLVGKPAVVFLVS